MSMIQRKRHERNGRDGRGPSGIAESAHVPRSVTVPTTKPIGVTTTASCASSLPSPPEDPAVKKLLQILKAVCANDPNVQVVSIANRPLPPLYVQALLEGIAANDYVRKLQLVRVGLSVSDDWLLALERCLLYAPVLVELDLSRNKLTTDVCRSLARASRQRAALVTSTSPTQPSGRLDISEMTILPCPLRKLNLTQNCIGDKGLEILLRDVLQQRRLPSLVSLRLGKQPFAERGVDALCRYMKYQHRALHNHNPCPLSRLDLRDCGLTDSFTVRLARSLSRATLDALYLAHNPLRTEGALALAKSLRNNTHLRLLDVRFPLVDDIQTAADDELIVARAFHDTLQHHNHVLVKLKLPEQECPPRGGLAYAARHSLLDLLVMNTHGPILAAQTKTVYRQLLRCLENNNGTAATNASPRYSDTACTKTPSRSGRRPSLPDLLELSDDSEWSEDSILTLKETDNVNRRNTDFPEHVDVERPALSCDICCEFISERSDSRDNRRSCTLLPCGHDNACEFCARKLRSCHMCRSPIVKIFVSSHERLRAYQPSSNGRQSRKETSVVTAATAAPDRGNFRWRRTTATT
jgi:hypothetical protein